MKWLQSIGLIVVGILVGILLSRSGAGLEGFVDVTQTSCEVCRKPRADCCVRGCGRCCSGSGSGSGSGSDDHKQCPQIDWSKYVLKASVPPCPPQPDMSKYMLKTECPAPPDMSKYVLKSAVPPCPPCISTCSKPCQIGSCPPCPRPRCPVVTCPEPKQCPPCAAVEPPRCPPPTVSCKANYTPEEPWMVRPLLASISER
jgi:hypothetical protein